LITTEKSSLIFSQTCRAIYIEPQKLKFWRKYINIILIKSYIMKINLVWFIMNLLWESKKNNVILFNYDLVWNKSVIHIQWSLVLYLGFSGNKGNKAVLNRIKGSQSYSSVRKWETIKLIENFLTTLDFLLDFLFLFFCALVLL
jgi:hypothetical protein